jgi:hypothetical protein
MFPPSLKFVSAMEKKATANLPDARIARCAPRNANHRKANCRSRASNLRLSRRETQADLNLRLGALCENPKRVFWG